MADYYPLITRAVAGLEKSTGEGRRGLYERARNALVEQLRSVTPALSESDITRERLALEEAIRKVEAEAVRQMRTEPAERRSARVAQEEANNAAPVANEPEPETNAAPPEPPPEPPAEPPPPRVPVPPLARTSQRRWLDKKKPPADAGQRIKGFGDVVADAENLGGATAEAGRAARETYSSVPSPTPEFERLEPRLDSGDRRPPPPPRTRIPERRPTPRPDLGPEVDPTNLELPTYNSPAVSSSRGMGRPLEAPMVPDSLRQVIDRARRDYGDDDEGPPLMRRLTGGAVKIGIAIALIALLAGTLYWQRNNLTAMVRNTFTSARAPTTQTPPRDNAQQRTKIPDRIGQADTNANARPQAEAPVAQRVVLYEDDPVEPAGKQFVGTVTWRAETSAAAPGQPADRAIRADITIPDRNMQIAMTIRRNADKDLPASHTVSIMFTLPQGFSNGGISEIRGMLMKQAEDTRGTSLAGLAVKVTPNYFLIGLSSAAEADIQRNLQLLKERSWFDIAIVYTNGRRAILAVEKGAPGERAFNDAFAAWGQ
jgi:hypothetical protein